MRSIKATKIILWLLALLILLICSYVYSKFYGTPWEKKQQATGMQTYLEEKYQTDFVIQKTSYNYLSESYQAYAYQRDHSNLLFMVEQDPDSKIGYSDTYPKVIWESDLSSAIKAKIKRLFPALDEPTLKAVRIVERGEYLGPHIPTYEEVNASQLSCSVTININTNWDQLNQKREKDKMVELSNYLKRHHFPVLIEVRYFEVEMHVNEKVFFITENGRIVER